MGISKSSETPLLGYPMHVLMVLWTPSEILSSVYLYSLIPSDTVKIVIQNSDTQRIYVNIAG